MILLKSVPRTTQNGIGEALYSERSIGPSSQHLRRENLHGSKPTERGFHEDLCLISQCADLSRPRAKLAKGTLHAIW